MVRDHEASPRSSRTRDVARAGCVRRVHAPLRPLYRSTPASVRSHRSPDCAQALCRHDWTASDGGRHPCGTFPCAGRKLRGQQSGLLDALDDPATRMRSSRDLLRCTGREPGSPCPSPEPAPASHRAIPQPVCHRARSAAMLTVHARLSTRGRLPEFLFHASREKLPGAAIRRPEPSTFCTPAAYWSSVIRAAWSGRCGR